MLLNALRQTFVGAVCLALIGIVIHVTVSQLYFHRRVSIFDAVRASFSNVSEHAPRSIDHVTRPNGHVTWPSSVVVVESVDNFTDRIQSFNDHLVVERRKTLEQRSGNETVWNFFDEPLTLPSSSSPLRVVSDETDDRINNHIDLLAVNFSHIATTVVLPWLPLPPSSSFEFVWNPVDDTVNVGLQLYYQWTGDDKLCRWFETSGTRKHTFDVLPNNRCERNITRAADQRGMLQPEVKAYDQEKSRGPNAGSPQLSSINTYIPPYVLYLHILQDAVVTTTGEVISGNVKLVCSLFCTHSLEAMVTTSQLPDEWGRDHRVVACM